MRHDTLVKVIADYADSLNRGLDREEEFVRRYPTAAAELSSLFHLTRQLKQALVPLPPPTTLLLQLQSLLTDAPTAVDDLLFRRRRAWLRAILVAAAAGLVWRLVRLRRLGNGRTSVTTSASYSS